jgi:hypothetical protein
MKQQTLLRPRVLAAAGSRFHYFLDLSLRSIELSKGYPNRLESSDDGRLRVQRMAPFMMVGPPDTGRTALQMS